MSISDKFVWSRDLSVAHGSMCLPNSTLYLDNFTSYGHRLNNISKSWEAKWPWAQWQATCLRDLAVYGTQSWVTAGWWIPHQGDKLVSGFVVCLHVHIPQRQQWKKKNQKICLCADLSMNRNICEPKFHCYKSIIVIIWLYHPFVKLATNNSPHWETNYLYPDIAAVTIRPLTPQTSTIISRKHVNCMDGFSQQQHILPPLLEILDAF